MFQLYQNQITDPGPEGHFNDTFLIKQVQI